MAPPEPTSKVPASGRSGAPNWVARHKRLTTLVAVVATAWAVAQTAPEPSNPDETSTSTSQSPAATAPADEKSTSPATAESKPTKSAAPAKERGPKRDAEPTKNATADTAASKPLRDNKPAPKPRRTYLVTRVIDGDTLELGNGETVRLVGVDTPEVGECGYERATTNLEDLVLYKRVRLTISDEDRDYYGRLLRYVDVGSKDAGLRLIQNGNAIARYDSRDGYGYHPREPRYIAADRGAENLTCPKPAPVVSAPKNNGGGGSCAPGYSPCVPPAPPDVNCPDVNGPIRVTGSDPHGLDADGDGIACES